MVWDSLEPNQNSTDRHYSQSHNNSRTSHRMKRCFLHRRRMPWPAPCSARRYTEHGRRMRIAYFRVACCADCDSSYFVSCDWWQRPETAATYDRYLGIPRNIDRDKDTTIEQ